MVDYLVPVVELPGFEPIEHACPACGEPIDYCQGHGLIGDPVGYGILKAHDSYGHDRCHAFASCQFDRAYAFVESTHTSCYNNTCDITAAFNLGFVRIAADLLGSAGAADEYDDPLPNFAPNHTWPEDEAWAAISQTRPYCECGSLLYEEIEAGTMSCGNCLTDVRVPEFTIELARKVAGDWHPGMMSGAYAFASSGAVTMHGVRYFYSQSLVDDHKAAADARLVLTAMGSILDEHLEW